jgi:hypothetical protein
MWPIPLVDDDCHSTYLIKTFQKTLLEWTSDLLDLTKFQMLHHLLASQEGINIIFLLIIEKTVTKLKTKSKCGEMFSKSSFYSKFGNEVFKWEYCDRK